MTFEVKVPGKWILAGEHSVLRGVPALVFPLYSSFLQLSYINADNEPTNGLQLVLEGEKGSEFQLLFWGVLERACELTNISRNQIFGKVKIQSTIPIGAGLGASAALSVAVARWFQYMNFLKSDNILDFARSLENLFHGESSGVDIAVAMSGKGLKFVRRGEQKVISPQNTTKWWSPYCYVSYSGKRGVTMECVNKVKNMIALNPVLGNQIDEDMHKAVRMAEQALFQNQSEGFLNLRKSIELAHSCFMRWDLIDNTSIEHMTWLKAHGAVAVKPTGSGNGGYILSLWDKMPDPETLKQLIPCF